MHEEFPGRQFGPDLHGLIGRVDEHGRRVAGRHARNSLRPSISSEVLGEQLRAVLQIEKTPDAPVAVGVRMRIALGQASRSDPTGSSVFWLADFRDLQFHERRIGAMIAARQNRQAKHVPLLDHELIEVRFLSRDEVHGRPFADLAFRENDDTRCADFLERLRGGGLLGVEP